MNLKNWALRDHKDSINIEVKIPETVFEALINNKLIEDPFYGLNEDKMNWVYDSEWIYETEFDLDKEFIDNSKIYIEFYGLDTIADIYINNKHIDSVKNMFRTHRYEVKAILKENSNRIEVHFHSPTEYALNMIEEYGVKLNTGEPGRAIPGIPYLRKAQYSFGWDWGPILPDIGIWKEVYLRAQDHPMISSVYINQEFDSKSNKENINQVNLEIKVEIEKLNDYTQVKELYLLLNIEDPKKKLIRRKIKVESQYACSNIAIKNPKLWWTHDLGTPSLYNLELKLKDNKILDEYKLEFGIRKLELITDADTFGESFYFKLNNIPIFIKGANWIPIDSFITRGKKLGLYRKNLQHAKNANMNMLRVWGGGIYEDNHFYEICNNLGILVWQDFPFACAIYPKHEDFMKEVKPEFVDNIKRLRNHPSLALWCGNNEIEYLWNWLKSSSKISDDQIENQYKEGYIAIFEEIIPKLIEKLDPNTPYWPSSPSNGFCGMNLGKINSNSPDVGDSHYWSVWHGGKAFKAYRRFNSRFMSEFGFESFPSIKTIKTFCPEDQYDINSQIMENHQKNDAGNDLIMKYIKKRYSIPIEFEKLLVLSQITQAEAIEYGVKHWRSNKSDYRSMGALYWQLNDCWPVASWSSVDYYGRWKALHYLAKRFYQPIIVDLHLKRNNLNFSIVNDSLEDLKLRLDWKILRSNGSIIKKDYFNILINRLDVYQLKEIEIDNLKNTQDLKSDYIIFYELSNKKDKNVIYKSYHLFGTPSEFALKNPELIYKINASKDSSIEKYNIWIDISCKNIALFTYIESEYIDFISTDNFFPLEPLESRKIGISISDYHKVKEKYSLEEIRESFKVCSFYDIIN
ncbi:MAG: hypothetical protein GF317_09585 [Candidatus Lokiarchaeota archaeon]|nr:hypothetical protein [Candidatus Lokiarchaeota archaeon]MBD3199961.1 hypothetical protein [Candidatus Lokiarchaeota archaeon]